MDHLNITPLAERVAVVTGAASGIGRELVLAMSEAGANIFAVDRDGRQIQLFKESADAKSNFAPVGVWKGFELPLDVVVNGNDVWVSDLGKPKVIKLDREGNRLYTWFWPTEGRDRFREMHTLAVDSDGNLYGSDNQIGRTQKLVPRKDADPKLLIGR